MQKQRDGKSGNKSTGPRHIGLTRHTRPRLKMGPGRVSRVSRVSPVCLGPLLFKQKKKPEKFLRPFPKKF